MNNLSAIRVTTDHDEIKVWAESRGGRPAVLDNSKGTSGEGVLRIKFAEEIDLIPINWNQFFEAFDENELALIYQEKTDANETSRYHKIVSRHHQDARHT